MTNHLDDFLVSDRESFIRFLDLLQQDYRHNPGAWKNSTLEKFLGAMKAYTEEIAGDYDTAIQEPNADVSAWNVYADILRGAKVYG